MAFPLLLNPVASGCFDSYKIVYTEAVRRSIAMPEINAQFERHQAHFLIDALPDEKVSAVRGLLEVMVEPLSRSLASVPVEEEELTPEMAAALDRSRASLARGEGIPHEEILREFGL
jgi:hypothetical protein